MKEDIKDDEAIEKSEALAEVSANPAVSLAEKISTAIKPVSDQRTESLTIAAAAPGHVLPAKFYEGASQLKLTDTECEILKDFSAVPDEEIDIRPDGLIYASHMFYRAGLTRIFGPGQWSLIPSSNAQTPRGDSELVYQAWVLVARGCYVGEAVGSARYLMNNPRRNWADAVETTRSDAISKICAKTLGIGVNPWNKRFAREWRKKNAIQVWVTWRGEREKRWRRIDDDPLEHEEKSAQTTPPQNATAQSSVGPTSSMTQPSGADTPPSTPPKAQPEAPRKPPPPKPNVAVAAEPDPETVRATEGNVRHFMAEARRRGLVVGDDGTKAIAFLVDTIGLPLEPKECSGKTQIEIIRQLLLSQTWRKFTDEILPGLMEVRR